LAGFIPQNSSQNTTQLSARYSTRHATRYAGKHGLPGRSFILDLGDLFRDYSRFIELFLSQMDTRMDRRQVRWGRRRRRGRIHQEGVPEL